jgi:hypothetical protein
MSFARNASGQPRVASPKPTTHKLNILLNEGPNADKSRRDALKKQNQNENVRKWENETGNQLAELRARPLLAVDMGEHGRYLVMPDAKNPGKTLLWPAP